MGNKHGKGSKHRPAGSHATPETPHQEEEVAVPEEKGPKWLHEFGTQGDGTLGAPYGVATDAQDNIYVADNNHSRIAVFSLAGTFLKAFASADELKRTSAVAVDNQGQVIVTDPFRHRVVMFSSDGAFLRAWGTKGKAEGELDAPSGVAVDHEGNIFVADTYNKRVQVFSSEGTFLRQWALPPRDPGCRDALSEFPHGIAVNGEGNVLVTDGTNRILVFSRDDGAVLKSFGGLEGNRIDQFSGLAGIAVDGHGNVFVVDGANHRIKAYSSDWTLHESFGSEGNGNNRFRHPLGVALTHDGKVVVCDTYNNRIVVVEP